MLGASSVGAVEIMTYHLQQKELGRVLPAGQHKELREAPSTCSLGQKLSHVVRCSFYLLPRLFLHIRDRPSAASSTLLSVAGSWGDEFRLVLDVFRQYPSPNVAWELCQILRPHGLESSHCHGRQCLKVHGLGNTDASCTSLLQYRSATGEHTEGWDTLCASSRSWGHLLAYACFLHHGIPLVNKLVGGAERDAF